MKKLISLVLALALVALCATAFAASITVNNTGNHSPETGATDNTEYEWYRIFDASFVNGTDAEDGVRYYTTSSTVKTALEAITVNTHTFTLTAVPGTSPTEYNITSNFTDTDAVALSEALYAAKSNWVKSSSTFKAGETQTVDPGYYLVTSTLGSKVILQTLGAENINEKNEYITDTKTVAKTNYNIGDQVHYTITVTIPATTDFSLPVTVHDTMDSVLALQDDSVTAKISTAGDFDDHISLVKSSAFDDDHATSHAAATGKTLFDFVLDISSLSAATTITIEYDAEVLNTAAADTDLVNEEFTEYSDYTTKPKDVKVKTFDFDLNKTFAGIATEDQGDYEATFELFGSDGTTAINLIEATEFEAYHLPDSTENATTNAFKVKGGGTVNVKGLEAGTYKVKETITSNGFNTMTDVITVVIGADGAVSYSFGSTDGTGTIPVVNQSGTTLPSTGGIGTTIFYIVGGMLLVGAAIVLVARRKASN